jgi:hypothetical protein
VVEAFVGKQCPSIVRGVAVLIYMAECESDLKWKASRRSEIESYQALLTISCVYLVSCPEPVQVAFSSLRLVPSRPLHTMTSVAGRKKSVISTAGLTIDTPVATNGLLNKAASQSTSLYQQCSALRSRLMLIRGFPHYFNLATPPDSRRSTDPVTQLWDLFALGIPLCYIFDLLPAEAGFNKINNSSFTEDYDANPDRAQKRAIALFAMQIRTDEVTQKIPGCELFTVTDLWDRKLTDGLVKVR